LLVAVNIAIGSQASLIQGIFSLVVCGIGALWGIWRYRKMNPTVSVAPLKPVLKAIVWGVLLTLALGLVFGPTRIDVCTRTHDERTTRYCGILEIRTINDRGDSQIIREVLKFNPPEHHWVMVAFYFMGGVGCGMPSHRYPMLNLSMDDLHILAKLKPVEKCHPLFQLDNPLDCKLAKIRERALWELKARLGQYGRARQGGTDEQIVEAWWFGYEPLLRPLRSEDDLKQAVLSYAAGGNRDFDDDLEPFAESVGLSAYRRF
jgi:hypothetical protein